MNVRVFAAAVLVAALAVVAVGATGASGGKAANTLTVWLQVDAQSGWPEVVAAANAQFRTQNPGWDVDVQYQTWGTHLAKFDATLAGNSAPDVIEMGNTEMTKYMAAGAFQDLSAVSFPNKSTWLAGSRSVREVRRQDLRRPVLRRLARRDVPHRHLQADEGEDPDQPGRVHRAREEDRCAKTPDKAFSPVYIAGTDWYVGHELRLRLRRQDRRSRAKGKWVGTLDTPKALAGLAACKRFFDAASRASKTTDEARPHPVGRLWHRATRLRRTGRRGSACCVGDYKNRVVAVRHAEPHEGPADPGLPRRI